MPPLHLEGIDPAAPVLFAFSSGVDSVVLLDLLREQASLALRLVYFDHGLRSRDEIDRDIELITYYGDRYSLPVTIRRLPVKAYAKKYKVGEEQAGRSLRYSQLRHFATLFKAPQVITAHHLSDDIEQKLSGLFKGSLSACINTEFSLDLGTATVYRPLRAWSKETIRNYALERELQFNEDSSNALIKYERNQFRNTIMPILKDSYPNIEENVRFVFSELARSHQESYSKVTQWATTQKMSHFPVEIDSKPLLEFSDFERNEAIKWILNSVSTLMARHHPSRLMCMFPFIRYTRQHISTLVEIFMTANDTRCQLPGLEVFRRGDYVAFLPQDIRTYFPPLSWKLRAKEGAREFPFLGLKLAYKFIESESDYSEIFEPDAIENRIFNFSGLLPKYREPGANIVCIDASGLENVSISCRLEGDYFTPLGMGSSQHLNHYLINQKFPIWKRDIWPLLRQNSQVIWIPGLQISNQVKIAEDSRRFLVLECGKLE